ncbi:hypothetical protein ACFOEQ_17620 [Chryseobacterium arachidis]|uniref:hypothetical protein n=1 Tax=Chryseobacterium arachidis TaxID=1416778 RepID=UPI003616E680
MDFGTKSQSRNFYFYQYPDLEKKHTVSLMSFVKFTIKNITKSVAMLKLAHWFKKNVEESGFKSFTTLKKERLPATTAIFLIILRREALTPQQNPLMQK